MFERKMADYELFIKECDDSICLKKPEKHFHCQYCSFLCEHLWRTKRHIQMCHISRAISFNNEVVYPCKIKHLDITNVTRLHYHCPVYDVTVYDGKPFREHLKTHAKTSTTCPSSTANDAIVNKKLETELNIMEELKDQSTRNNPTMKKCDICNKLMHAKSIVRHKRDVHDTSSIPDCVCVDDMKGIFFVRKYFAKRGVPYRTHVQKLIKPDVFSISCEMDACIDYMNVAKRSGMPITECIHLQQCSKSPLYVPKKVLSFNTLENLSGKGQLKILSDQTISNCKKLHQIAAKGDTHLIVAVGIDDRFIHFSVMDEGIHYYAKLGRVTVVADMHKGYLDCSCCSRNRGCLHKGICKWYLHEAGKLENLGVNNLVKEDDGITVDDDNDVNTCYVSGASSSLKTYPPTDPKVITKMCEYLRQQKKIPMAFEPPAEATIGSKKNFFPEKLSVLFAKWLLMNQQLLLSRLLF